MWENLIKQEEMRSPLLPERHPEPDFFICDLFDAAPKSDTASMEHPLFSLSTKPDMKRREYKIGNAQIRLEPSAIGLATVHDRDVLIYCVSQCMKRINEGKPIHRKLRFSAHNLLVTTNRDTSKNGYDLLRSALKRLQGTQIETNIMTGGIEQWDVFSFIESAKTVKETRDGRMQALEITLSDWIYNALKEKSGEILTISRDYFRLRKPLERRLYELARKHCGTQSIWKFKIKTLHERMGSTSKLFEFRRMLKKIIDENAAHHHIPDYEFYLDGDIVVIRPRAEFKKIFRAPKRKAVDQVKLASMTHEKAKKFARGWDIYHLEQEWRRMLADKKSEPKNPDGSFIAFIKNYTERNGPAQRALF